MFKRINPLLFGFALLLVVMYDMVCWIYISQHTHSFEASRAAYLARYPDFMQHARLITFVEILVLALAIYLFSKRQKVTGLKVMRIIGLVLGITALYWLVFSLM